MIPRRLAFGLATVLGIARRGFFIPYRYAATVPAAGHRPPYEPMAGLMAAHEDDFAAVLALVDRHAGALAAIGDAPPPAPRWTQDWFPRLDAAAAYVLIREAPPRLVVEVGSGHSTRFIARAVADAGAATRVVAIDPAPRASLDGLAVERIAATVQEAGGAPFAMLGAGDVLFIDSSHVLMPGSDVDWLLNRVLPALPAGVRVHIHDVFLPDDYPPEWDWRGYNEQSAVAALLAGGGWRPLFASHYAATRLAKAVAASAAGPLPLSPGAHDSSLWIEKR